MRSAVFAQAAQTLFQRLVRPFSPLRGWIQRVRAEQGITAFDDNWLAEFSMRQANISAPAAGRNRPVRKTVVKRHAKADLREAA